MMQYTIDHVNRLVMPTKHLLIVEDDLLQQARFAKYFLNMFGHQSNVRINIVCSAVDAHLILATSSFQSHYRIDLVILDHDLQIGNGSELVREIRALGITVPVITASEIDANNVRMMEVGANYLLNKEDILRGYADGIVREHLGPISTTTGWEGHL